MSTNNREITPEIRAVLAKWGSKGGKRGSHEDKVKAGRAGYAAMKQRIIDNARKAGQLT